MVTATFHGDSIAMTSGSAAASWTVELAEGIFRIEFEHGAASGKRVIRINGKEILRRDWMFRLVGSEQFIVGRSKFEIDVHPSGTMGFTYNLYINSQPLDRFTEQYRKNHESWVCSIGSIDHRVILEKDVLDVWVDGNKTLTQSTFTENGSEIHFQLEGTSCIVKSMTSGNKREGLIYSLHVDGRPIESQ